MTTSTRGSTYKLSGFREFSSWCPISFKETLPNIRVCRLCGVVPSVLNLLPCRHGVCGFCKTLTLKGTPKCPLDGERFKETDVLKLECSLEDLTEREVYCPNKGGKRTGCTFSGKLIDLSKHLSEDCLHCQVQCPQCGGGFARRAIIAHHSRCEGMNSRRMSTRGRSSQQQSGEMRRKPYEQPFDYECSTAQGRRKDGFETMKKQNGSPQVAGEKSIQSGSGGPFPAQHPTPLEAQRREDNTCNMNHETIFVECVKGVVYRIPLTCGRHYVGETSECLNERLKWQRWLLGTELGNLAKHCSRCTDSQPLFHLTAVLENCPNLSERLVLEAEYIKDDREKCINDSDNSALRADEEPKCSML
ncbi:uncharacterized protein LOC144118877 [Amblyomma americanum]